MSRKYRLLHPPTPTVCIVQSFDFVSKGGRVDTTRVTIRAIVENGKLARPILETADFVPPGAMVQIDEWAVKNCGLEPGTSLLPPQPPFDPKQKLSAEARLDLIADITHYGVAWVDGHADAHAIGLETVAHTAACCLFQWFKLEGEVGTSETLEALHLDEYPGWDDIRKYLDEYLEYLQQ